MKLTVLLVWVLSLSFSMAQAEQADQIEDEGFKFECVWQKSAKHAPGYFVENSKFVLHFLPGDDGELSGVKILEDSFFNRTYIPCWKSPEQFSSCMFSYSYNPEKIWEVDEENDVLTQSWRQSFEIDYNDGLPAEAGTVDGISELRLETSDEKGLLRLVGDDGDGTWFEEDFACKAIDNPFLDWLLGL